MPRTSARLRRKTVAKKTAVAREEEADSEKPSSVNEEVIPIGSKVRKHFAGHGWFNGEVDSLKHGLYKVIYEDGDEEECNQRELYSILVRRSNTGTVESMEENSTDDEGDEEDYCAEDEIEESDAPMTESDDDIYDGLNAKPKKIKMTKLEATRTNAEKVTPQKAKRASVLVTPSPSKAKEKQGKKAAAKQKKSPSKASSSSAMDASKIYIKASGSIATRGLPRGALAKCKTSGLTIRGLDSILPLRHARVSSASFLYTTNDDSENNNNNNNNNDDDNNCSSNNKQTVLTLDTPLPGRILVVNVGDGCCVCPPSFVGRSFDSAADLYAALPPSSVSSRSSSSASSIMKLDYSMEVVADPVFAPWEFVQARLQSCGLLDAREDDKGGEILGPLLYVVQIQWDGESQISGGISWYKEYIASSNYPKDDLQWAIIEATQRDMPSVLVGAPLSLVEHSERNQGVILDTQNGQDLEAIDDYDETTTVGCDSDLVPPPSAIVSRIRLPASLLQKAIRRGSGLCSQIPLLEACEALLLSKTNSVSHQSKPLMEGSTLAMLKMVWGCMLVDASPFNDSHDCLGLPSLVLLSLVAKANPQWIMPMSLCRAAVASALRTANSAPSQPWLGFVARSDDWWKLEDGALPTGTTTAKALAPNSEYSANQKGINVRNILRVAQSVVGGRLAWGKWNSFIGDPSAAAVLSYLNKSEWDGSKLPEAPQPPSHEASSLAIWGNGNFSGLSLGLRLDRLDKECRFAAIEPTVIPVTLVLLQSLLARPPSRWKKHGLPSLSRQIRKLISEANPRIRERVQLARLATWGKEKAATPISSRAGNDKRAQMTISTTNYESFREVVTPSGTLSEQEVEVIDCFEAIQEWLSDRLEREPTPNGENSTVRAAAASQTKSTVDGNGPRFNQVKAGSPLTHFDGRIAFLLAFATSIEVEVCPDSQSPSVTEVVAAMFCGDASEPLLVQRIGKARQEGQEAATVGGTTSGATAVPSLGYVQRGRSLQEARLFAATEVAVAKHWKDGKTSPLPLPPIGLQWDLPDIIDSDELGWEEKEASVRRTATLVTDESGTTSWKFSIAGIKVEAFDARAVVSPCALDLGDESYQPERLEPGSERYDCLKVVLYVNGSADINDTDLLHGRPVLRAMSTLHSIAESDRRASRQGLSEGRVFDWMPLACQSLLPARTWRDALLAIRTRENDFVVLGRGIAPDGTGAPRDMVEGVLVRIFHGLEMLYPQAIRKEAALKFRVRPRGAAYYNMLASLERLGRGEGLLKAPVYSVEEVAKGKVGLKRKKESQREEAPQANEAARLRKRPRRSASVAASKKNVEMIDNEASKPDKQECSDSYISSDSAEQKEGSDYLPLPKIKTTLWAHQEKSVSKVVEGVRQGRRGHADASAVGAGKTLTALATIVRLAHFVAGSGRSRHGVLIMLPTKALIREWLLEIAAHTEGFHVIEQREDGQLFSLTYGKSHPPIDGNALIISTLDRVCNHPFVRQVAWDFVVIDECLSVQNAAAKRNPSAWRQIEASMCGVLMLSATFFRSKYDQLFYMIRMLRSPLPRTMEWLPATIHEHIVCQIPETNRHWSMRAEMVPLIPQDLRKYRDRIEAFRRKQINEPSTADGRKLWVELESFLRDKYEGRDTRATTAYRQSSPMGDAFAKAAKGLLRKKRRPLIFADTSHEADFLLRSLRKEGLDAQTWASIASLQISASSEPKNNSNKTVIVAVKTVEGQGINMQKDADAIICRPTAGDHLEQMKGRVDRPGQKRKELLLVVMVCEHTIEEAKFSNIRLAGNFFREFIAPVATKYRERIDLEATLAAGGTAKLKPGTISGAWRRSLEAAGQSGAFASLDDITSTSATSSITRDFDTEIMDEDFTRKKKTTSKKVKAKEEPKYKPLNKVLRNKGDPEAVRQAKHLAKNGHASLAIRHWLSPPKVVRSARPKGLAKDSLQRFSDATPPVVLDRDTVYKAVTHLSNSDEKLASLIARVGADALVSDCGTPMPATQARLFDRCVRAITFTMISVDAGNAFLRRLAMKLGVCIEQKSKSVRDRLLNDFLHSIQEGGNKSNLTSPEHLLQLLLDGKHGELSFTHPMVNELVKDCEIIKGKRTGYPHLCGVTFPCGKNDDHSVFVDKARDHAKGSGDPVSAGFSNGKASFIISLVEDFARGKISGEKISMASDREAAKMLMELKGIGDWCAGGVLMHFLSRADICLYGDLTVRNYLNDLYDINHQDNSETLLESAADFADTGPNRNLIDALAKEKGWAPYRSVVCYLMYHLQEENLVLL